MTTLEEFRDLLESTWDIAQWSQDKDGNAIQYFLTNDAPENASDEDEGPWVLIAEYSSDGGIYDEDEDYDLADADGISVMTIQTAYNYLNGMGAI